MKVLFVALDRFSLALFYRLIKNTHEELEMNLQFSIDEGNCLSKENINLGFRKFCGEIPVVFKDHFNDHPITIFSATITNEVAADLEHQFNLSGALAVLEKSMQI